MEEVHYRIAFRPDRRFEYVSDSVEALVGYTPEEHYADPDLGLRIVHPADLPSLQAYVSDPTKMPSPLLLRWVAKDGRIVLTEHKITFEYGEDGAITAIEGEAREFPGPPSFRSNRKPRHSS